MSSDHNDSFDQNPYIATLTNYMTKKEILHDFTEKQIKLKKFRKFKLDEYKQIYEEMNINKCKRRSLLKMYMKIGRCVFYENVLNDKISALSIDLSVDFLANVFISEDVKIAFEFLFYFIESEQLSWNQIVQKLETENLVDKILSVDKNDISDAKIEFMKLNYIEKNEISPQNFFKNQNFWFLKLLIEWLISQILFRDYKIKMLEIDDIIIKVNEEKSGLENDELLIRNLIGEISYQIDSVVIKCQELNEEIEFAVTEEMARESIANHLQNEHIDDYDISEILTRGVSTDSCRPGLLPLMIQLSLQTDEGYSPIKPEVSFSPSKTVPQEWRPTILDSRVNFDEIQMSKSNLSQSPDVVLINRKKSIDATFNHKLNQELDRIKQDLMAEKPRQLRNSGLRQDQSMDDFYLKLLNQNAVSQLVEVPKVSNVKQAQEIQVEFEQIVVHDFSDNISENNNPKFDEFSIFHTKHFLHETGFSKFDALLGKSPQEMLPVSAKFVEKQSLWGGINFNDFQAATMSYLDKKQPVSISDIDIQDDLLHKIDQQIKEDRAFLARMENERTEEDRGKQNLYMTLNEPKTVSLVQDSLSKSEIIAKLKNDNYLFSFTSFQKMDSENRKSRAKKNTETNSQRNSYLISESELIGIVEEEHNSIEELKSLEVTAKSTFLKYKVAVDIIVVQYIQSNLMSFLQSDFGFGTIELTNEDEQINDSYFENLNEDFFGENQKSSSLFKDYSNRNSLKETGKQFHEKKQTKIEIKIYKENQRLLNHLKQTHISDFYLKNKIQKTVSYFFNQKKIRNQFFPISISISEITNNYIQTHTMKFLQSNFPFMKNKNQTDQLSIKQFKKIQNSHLFQKFDFSLLNYPKFSASLIENINKASFVVNQPTPKTNIYQRCQYANSNVPTHSSRIPNVVLTSILPNGISDPDCLYSPSFKPVSPNLDPLFVTRGKSSIISSHKKPNSSYSSPKTQFINVVNYLPNNPKLSLVQNKSNFGQADRANCERNLIRSCIRPNLFENIFENSESRSPENFKNSFGNKFRNTHEISQHDLFKRSPVRFVRESDSKGAELIYPISFHLNGKDLCLVRVDKNVNVYRYKEDLMK